MAESPGKRAARFGALLAAIGLVVLYWLLRTPADGVQPEPLLSPEATAGWYQVLFTDPTGPNAATLRGGPDQALAQAIDQARFSADLAVLRLNLWSVRDALLRAHERGVRVRVVTEREYLGEREVEELIASGIEVIGDTGEGLMHHKFVVIDSQWVWSGSMNFTVGSAYRDNNSLLSIESHQLAENFSAEFEEMFTHGRFGPSSLADTPHPVVAVLGSEIETWFSPDDGVAARIVQVLREAQSSIDVMAFNLTLDAIAEVMLQMARSGVGLRVVLDEGQSANPGGDLDRLRQAGVEVRLDGEPGNMHHKVILIDGSIVITGSYNFSRSAEQLNDEYVLIIHDRGLAGAYLGEFERIFARARP